jgi:hypothetical protein
VFRVVAAIILSLSISESFKFWLFTPELELELERDRQAMMAAEEKKMDTRFAEIDTLVLRNAALTKEVADLRADLALREVAVVDEAQGTSPTQQRGRGEVWEEKTEARDSARARLSRVEAQNDSLIAANRKRIAGLEALKERERRQTETFSRDLGFFARFRVFMRLQRGADGRDVRVISYFITLVFLIVELAPVTSKALAHRGPYDATVQRQEDRVREEEDRMREDEIAAFGQHTEEGQNERAALQSARTTVFVQALDEAVGSTRLRRAMGALQARIVAALVRNLDRRFAESLSRSFDDPAAAGAVDAMRRETEHSMAKTRSRADHARDAVDALKAQAAELNSTHHGEPKGDHEGREAA